MTERSSGQQKDRGAMYLPAAHFQAIMHKSITHQPVSLKTGF